MKGNQDTVSEEGGSAPPTGSSNKFSSALKAYSSPANSSSSSFTISTGNSKFTVYDETVMNTAANAAPSSASPAVPAAEFLPHPSAYSHLPSPQFSDNTNGTLHSTQLESALNDMLMAWYHSGYATGRYQTLLEVQQQQQQQQQQQPPQESDAK